MTVRPDHSCMGFLRRRGPVERKWVRNWSWSLSPRGTKIAAPFSPAGIHLRCALRHRYADCECSLVVIQGKLGQRVRSAMSVRVCTCCGGCRDVRSVCKMEKHALGRVAGDGSRPRAGSRQGHDASKLCIACRGSPLLAGVAVRKPPHAPMGRP